MTTSSLENGNFFFFMYFHFPISQIKSICAQDYMVTIKKKKNGINGFSKKNFYAKKKKMLLPSICQFRCIPSFSLIYKT